MTQERIAGPSFASASISPRICSSSSLPDDALSLIFEAPCPRFASLPFETSSELPTDR